MSKTTYLLIVLLLIVIIGSAAYFYYTSSQTQHHESPTGEATSSDTSAGTKIPSSITKTTASVEKMTTYINTAYAYQITYPAALEMDADVYGGSADLSKERTVYLRSSDSDRFTIEVLDPGVYPSSATLSLKEYVDEVHSLNTSYNPSAVSSLSIGAQQAFSFTTNGSFNAYESEKYISGWTAEAVGNKPQTFVFVKKGNQVLRIWFPTTMTKAWGILNSLEFL